MLAPVSLCEKERVIQLIVAFGTIKMTFYNEEVHDGSDTINVNLFCDKIDVIFRSEYLRCQIDKVWATNVCVYTKRLGYIKKLHDRDVGQLNLDSFLGGDESFFDNYLIRAQVFVNEAVLVHDT